MIGSNKTQALSNITIIINHFRSSWSSGYGQSPVDASPSPSLVSVTTPSTLLNRNDVKMSPTPSPAGSETAKPTGYSYKTVHWPKSGLATGYNNFHFK